MIQGNFTNASFEGPFTGLGQTLFITLIYIYVHF